MPRANRHFLPNHIWHIIHRCHKREFLLKFAKDRQMWMGWLFKAKKRFGLKILDYMVTSNHIHLLIAGNKDQDVIPKSIQLIAGRTDQEYNQRKKRNAFWEDRYHATAVESGIHLSQCLVYIDLNRPGLVFNSGFEPSFDAGRCVACETCIERCPPEALTMGECKCACGQYRSMLRVRGVCHRVSGGRNCSGKQARFSYPSKDSERIGKSIKKQFLGAAWIYVIFGHGTKTFSVEPLFSLINH